MKIDESSCRVAASHSYEYRQTMDVETESGFRNVLMSADARLASSGAVPEKAAAGTGEALRIRRLLQEFFATMLALLSGEKCRQDGADIAASGEALPAAAEKPSGLPGRGMTRQFEWRRHVVESIEEHERTAVTASGCVKTADGREIDFRMDLQMCRDFSCTREREESGTVVFRDPLVINYAGKAAELSNQRFSFDLDADGLSESLPMLAGGSGYLVFDADRDGRIANGRELFGALSGDGFADLVRLDEDGNGWLDEADPAFTALGVWFPDGQIKPLAATGVGALNTASAWSPFALNDADNRPLGRVQQTGFYLGEDGSVGSLQQIDLAAPPATT